MRILICTAGQVSYLRLTIDAYRFTAPEVPITLIARPPDAETRDWLTAQDDLDVVFSEIEGPAKLDLGLHRCTAVFGDDVIVTSDDVIPLTQHWAGLAQDHLNQAASIHLGAVGARANITMKHQLCDQTEPAVEGVPFLSGIWLLVTRACLEDVGGPDPELKPPGWMSDLEWTYRMAKQGWAVLVDRRILVWHWGSQTLQRQGLGDASDDAAARWNTAYMYRKYPELNRIAEAPA